MAFYWFIALMDLDLNECADKLSLYFQNSLNSSLTSIRSSFTSLKDLNQLLCDKENNCTLSVHCQSSVSVKKYKKLIDGIIT